MRVAAVVFTITAAMLLTSPRSQRRVRPPRAMDVATFVGAGASTIAIAALFAPLSAAAVAGAAGLFLPAGLRQSRERRSRKERAQAWPDFLGSVQSRLTSGYTLGDAVVHAATGPLADLREAAMVSQRSGTSLSAATSGLRASWEDATADRVVFTLDSAARAGGPEVAQIIERLAISVHDELAVRQSHAAAMTQQRLTAFVALGAPWVLLWFTLITNPQAHAAYSEPAGSAVVATGSAATLVGYLLTRRVMRLSEPPRVFR